MENHGRIIIKPYIPSKFSHVFLILENFHHPFAIFLHIIADGVVRGRLGPIFRESFLYIFASSSNKYWMSCSVWYSYLNQTKNTIGRKDKTKNGKGKRQKKNKMYHSIPTYSMSSKNKVIKLMIWWTYEFK